MDVMGPVLCLLSATAFGAMAIFGKFAYAAGVSTDALLLVRFSLAAVLLFSLDAALRRRAGDRTPLLHGLSLRTVLIAVVGLGSIGYAAQAGFFFAALQVMDAGPLSMIYYTYPALVTLAAAVLGRERLTRARVLALVLASLGVLLVLAGSAGATVSLLGIAFGFGCAFTYTGYVLVSDRIVPLLPPVRLAALVMGGASLTMLGRTTLQGGVDLTFGAEGWLWLAALAVVSTVVAMVTFFAGMRRTGPSTAAILSTFEPVVTTVLAALVLAELPTPVQLAGGALVLVSVAVLQAPARVRLRRARPVELAPAAA